jgi:hypothetical protein
VQQETESGRIHSIAPVVPKHTYDDGLKLAVLTRFSGATVNQVLSVALTNLMHRR